MGTLLLPVKSRLITHSAEWGHYWYLLQSSLITHSADWGHYWYLLQSSLITYWADGGHLWYLLQSSLITHSADWGHLQYSSVSSVEFHISGDTGCHIRCCITIFATEYVFFLILLQPKFRFKYGQGCRNMLGVRGVTLAVQCAAMSD